VEVPEGFSPIFRSSPFLEAIGPLFSKGRGAELVIGLRVAEKHCNARGTVHGGLLATLCDIALGYTMAFSSEPPLSLTTSGLSLTYFGAAKLGDWIESRVSIDRLGSRLAFASCDLAVSGRRLVHAAGIYAVSGSLGSDSK
jgi:acyl-coenzyme A thioesterase PaaI-like protein